MALAKIEYLRYLNPDPETYVSAEVLAELTILDELLDFFLRLHLISFVEVCTMSQLVLSIVTLILSFPLLLDGKPLPLMIILAPETDPLVGDTSVTVGRTTNSYGFPKMDVF